MANENRSTMTAAEKAEWEKEFSKEFEAAERIFLPRKDAGDTKVWTASPQLSDYKIPKLAR